MTKEDHFEYGVEDLADMLDLGGASVRIKLRNAGIKKASNGRYGWKTKSELKEIADKLKTTPAAPIPASERKGSKPKADAKPAKEKPVKEKAAKPEKSDDKPAKAKKEAKPAKVKKAA